MVTFTIANKNRPTATVVMIVSLFGKQYRKSIGVGLPPRYWSSAKHRAKVTADFDGKPINEAIERWEEIGRQAIRKFASERRIPTSEEFAKIISDDIDDEREKTDYSVTISSRYTFPDTLRCGTNEPF